MRIIATASALIVLVLSSHQPAYAHHSLSAYDISKVVTVEGTIKNYEWGAPHCWLVVAVGDPKGKLVLWKFEAGTPIVNTKFGWTRNTFAPGEKVKVTAAPLRDGAPGGALMAVEMPDGRTLAGPLATYLKQ